MYVMIDHNGATTFSNPEKRLRNSTEFGKVKHNILPERLKKIVPSCNIQRNSTNFSFRNNYYRAKRQGLINNTV